jgi:hypothetical protein
MSDNELTQEATQGLRTSRELQGHLNWLDSFTPLALGILATASGIYTYIGVSGLLESSGSMTFFAAIAYSVAVSVGIFVFWAYLMRLLPAVTTAASRIGLVASMCLGSLAIVAMSSWLNAAALAGSAAVEQHLARTLEGYQAALERAHENAVAAQALERDVSRARVTFESLSEQEQSGELSGIAGQGAVYRLLRQKAQELASLESQIASQEAAIAAEFERGNAILNRMRELTVETTPIKARSVAFAEQSVRLAGVISTLRQLSVASMVKRAADDLRASAILPELDGRSDEIRGVQSATMTSVFEALEVRSRTLIAAASEVLDLPPPEEATYTPISTADAVIRYRHDFIPSWAGAIAIDLLPGVLVFILAITHAVIRQSRATIALEQTMTLADLRAALGAMNRLEGAMNTADAALIARLRALDRGEAPPPEGEDAAPKAPAKFPKRAVE